MVCLTASFAPARSGLSTIQQTIASTSWVTIGALFGRQIMSPRDTSRSSASRTVTDIGAYASSTGPSAVSIAAIRVVSPPAAPSRRHRA